VTKSILDTAVLPRAPFDGTPVSTDRPIPVDLVGITKSNRDNCERLGRKDIGVIGELTLRSCLGSCRRLQELRRPASAILVKDRYGAHRLGSQPVSAMADDGGGDVPAELAVAVGAEAAVRSEARVVTAPIPHVADERA